MRVQILIVWIVASTLNLHNVSWGLAHPMDEKNPPPDITGLVAQLKSPKDKEVLIALDKLWELGRKGRPAIKAMKPLIAHKNPTVRLNSVYFLFASEEKSPEVTEYLSTFLNDEDKRVVATSLQLLIEIEDALKGDVRQKVIMRASVLIGHKSSLVRLFSSILLSRIDPSTRKPLVPLCRLLDDADTSIQCAAMKELAKRGEEAFSILADGLKETPSTRYKINMISTLGMVLDDQPRFSEKILPHLVVLVQDESDIVRRRAKLAIDFSKKQK